MNTDRQISITPDSLIAITCQKVNCDSELFTQAVMIRKLSALISPTAQEQKIQIPVFVCLKCQTVQDELLPDELRKKSSKTSPNAGGGFIIA